MTSLRKLLGIWVGEAESAKFWLSVLNEIKNRGVKDILIVSIDGLKGFFEAIASAFPETKIQRCILHQIRASTRYISYKDIKAFTAALKKIHQAATEELATFFKYPKELRRVIYTTNNVE